MNRSRIVSAHQGGFTFWTLLVYLLVFGGVLILSLRIAPSYLEYLTVKDIVERAVDDFDPQTQSSTEIRTRIRKLLHTSQVDVELEVAAQRLYRPSVALCAARAKSRKS